MAELLQENWLFLAIALVIGLLVAWWIFAANRTTKVEIAEKDEGQGTARRNQALIDATPAVSKPEAPAAAPAVAPVEEVAPPAPAPVPAPAPAATDSVDDLTQIKGLGPKLKTMLGEMGVTSFAQIAAWEDADIDRIDAQLGRFQGRIRRDNWVEQAKLLAAGDRAAYENQFGRT